MGEPRNQFTFYRSFYEGIAGLPKKDRAATLLAVCAYALYEEEPSGLSVAAKVAFELIRPVLDSGRKKAFSGKQGGSKAKAKPKQTESKPEANGKQNESKMKAKTKQGENASKVENNDDVDIDADVEGEGNASRQYALGETKQVFLNEGQIDVLIRQMGRPAFDRYVDKLSDFISRTGAKVYDHYETILRWWEEDKARPTAPAKKADRNAQYQTHGGELSDWERKAVAEALAESE